MKADMGDWIGIYVDGRLVDEGHSLGEERTLDAVGIIYTEEVIDFEERGWGRCPESLDDQV